MGTFENIARHGCSEFELGGCVDKTDFNYQFGKDLKNLVEKEVRLKPISCDELNIIRLQRSAGWRLKTKLFDHILDAQIISYDQISEWLGRAIRHQSLPYGGNLDSYINIKNPQASEINSFVLLSNYLSNLSSLLPSSDSVNRELSPFIERPQRTYSRSRLHDIDDNHKNIKELTRSLSRFGNKMELFAEIEISPNRDGESLEFVISGRKYNLVDVGLGIHTILDTLTALCHNNSEETLLLQQPETHLHPEAQALFADIVVNSKKRFVIETHTDFFINRFSICVRQRKLTPEQVGVIWFERKQDAVTLHEISFDEQGNVHNAPPNYRDFFKRELNAFLGFDS